MKLHSLIAACAVAAMIAGVPVFGQASKPAAKKAAKASSAKPEKKNEDESEDRWLHIVNVDVHPVVGPRIRQGEILIKNSKIEAVGTDLEAPEGAETLDGMGFRAYPGLVALNGGGIVPRASGKIEDSSHPNGVWNFFALAHGITTVITGTTAVKIQTGTVEDYVLRKSLFTALSYSRSNPRAKIQLEKDLRRARDFLRKRRAGELKAKPAKPAANRRGASSTANRGGAKKPSGGGSASLGSAARYLPLLEGKATAVFNAASSQEIRDVAHLVEAFGFRAIVRGAVEGWTIPGEVGRSGLMAIVSPRERRDPNDSTDRPSGSTVSNAAILHNHGVRIAIASIGNTVDLDGSPGRDGISLAFDAGAAVGGGLPDSEALRAITINAAQMYQIDDRVGSIEAGKDADVIITDGEMLHYATHVQWAIVNGRIVYDKEKESFLRDIRSRTKTKKESKPWWPRPFGEMPEEWSFDPAKAAAERDGSSGSDEEKSEEKEKDSEKKDPKGGKDKPAEAEKASESRAAEG